MCPVVWVLFFSGAISPPAAKISLGVVETVVAAASKIRAVAV